MADRRRVRRSPQEGVDQITDESSSARKERPSECESEGDAQDGGDLNSEYESAEDKDEDEEEETDSEEEETDDEDEDDDEEDDEDEDGEEGDDEEYEDDDVIIEDEAYDGLFDEERQSGDGEEQPDEKTGNVDDDEDRKNPAYIPRKGAFYEHDMRTFDDGERRPKKPLWKDDGKWLHDRYSENQQAPKSREELIALYGYDIRAHSKPPDLPPRMNKPRTDRRERKPRFGDFINEDQDQHYEDRNVNRNENEENDRYERIENERYEQNENERNLGYSRGRGGRGYSQRYNQGGMRPKKRRNFRPRELPPENDRPYQNSDNRQHNYNSVPHYQNSYNERRTPDRNSPAKIEISTSNEHKEYENINITKTVNSDTVQTTIVVSNTVEKKSYSKERRGRHSGRTRVQDDIDSMEHNMSNLSVADRDTSSPKSGDEIVIKTSSSPKQSEKKNYSRAPRLQKHDSQQKGSKRYSSLRQRTAPDANYESPAVEGSNFYPGYREATAFHQQQQQQQQDPKRRQNGNFTSPILQTPMAFTIPVSSATGLQNSPRVYNPAAAAAARNIPASSTQGHPLIGPQYLPAGMLYGGPPAAFPLPGGQLPAGALPPPPAPLPQGQLPPTQIPPPPPPAPVPPTQIPPPIQGFPSPPSQPELYRGGTTYYPTELQPPSTNMPAKSGITYYPPQLQQTVKSRSPVKRTKAAIPIVNPQDMRRRRSNEQDGRMDRSSPSKSASRTVSIQEQIRTAQSHINYSSKKEGQNGNSSRDSQTPNGNNSKNGNDKYKDEARDRIKKDRVDRVGKRTDADDSISSECVDLKSEPIQTVTS